MNLPPTPPLPPLSNDAELTRTFNSAVVATTGQVTSSPDLSKTFRSTEYRTILEAVRRLARLENISEKDASERLIKVFRQVDTTWKDYVIQEGLTAVRNKMDSTVKSAK